MGRDHSHRFLEHWHRRTVDLPDGDRLHYIVIDHPDRPAQFECPRTERRGAIHSPDAARMLAELDHPDAAIAASRRASVAGGYFR